MADEQKPTAENMTMLQGFEWYVPADGRHWNRLEKHVPQLKAWGIDNIWIPPALVSPSLAATDRAYPFNLILRGVAARPHLTKATAMTSTTCMTWASSIRRGR